MLLDLFDRLIGSLGLFILSFSVIIVSYVLIGDALSPYLKSISPKARVGGVWLFMTLAVFQIQLVIKGFSVGLTAGDFTDVNVTLLQVNQALAAFLFLAGLYKGQEMLIKNPLKSRWTHWLFSTVGDNIVIVSFVSFVDKRIIATSFAYVVVFLPGSVLAPIL